MKKVYLVTFATIQNEESIWDFNGCQDITGVFSTLEKALTYVEKELQRMSQNFDETLKSMASCANGQFKDYWEFVIPVNHSAFNYPISWEWYGAEIKGIEIDFEL